MAYVIITQWFRRVTIIFSQIPLFAIFCILNSLYEYKSGLTGARQDRSLAGRETGRTGARQDGSLAGQVAGQVADWGLTWG